MNTKKNIPLFKVFMAPEVSEPLLEVLHSGWIGEGPKVTAFEEVLSKHFTNPNVLTLNSGTAGLHLAYHMALHTDRPKSYRNSNQDEVITTPITCTATNTPILNNGAKIVWADVDPVTGNIDPEDIKRKITKNTKAITMVHWGGNPCQIDEINAIAKEHGIKTIEDCAHSMGAKYKGKSLGGQSDYTMFSLQAIKHITSVDGGILLTKSAKDFERAKLLRWYGIDRTTNEKVDLRCEIDVAEAGYKFHMNDVSATIGMANFAHLDNIIKKHRDNAEFYNEVFSNSPDIKVAFNSNDANSAYWIYTILVNNRDELMEKLKEDGIMASKVHARNDTHSMFKEFCAELPNATKFNDFHLCIPVGWWVTKEDRDYIADKVLKHAR